MDSGWADDFEGFYHANFGDTVAMSYGFTADIGEAQDIAQEAFARAWIRWRQLSTYENPVGWVRHVAANLARSRWRQVKRASAYLVRHRPESVAGPNPDHVAVVAALRKLPPRQREAIVMHHLLDLSVEEVADQLHVPAGTVKSWLHRGRNALAVDLSIDIRNDVKTPPAGEIVQQAKKRQRRRSAQVAVGLVLVLVGFAALAQAILQRRQPVINPTPTPSQSSSPIVNVNWDSPTINISGAPASCPGGSIAFRRTEFEGIAGPAGTENQVTFLPGGLAFGDLTADGRQDAAIIASCPRPTQGAIEQGAMIVQQQPDGSLLSQHWLNRPGGHLSSVWIEDGTVYLDTRPGPGSASRWDYQLGEVTAFRMQDGQFKMVQPGPGYLPLLPTRDDTRLDLSPLASKLTKCDDLPIPDAIKPSFDRTGVWQDGPRQWTVAPHGLTEPSPVYVSLGTDRHYVLLTVTCGPTRTSTSIVLFDRAADGWKAIGVIAGEARSDLGIIRVTGPVVEVTGTGQEGWAYEWNGSQFVRKTT